MANSRKCCSSWSCYLFDLINYFCLSLKDFQTLGNESEFSDFFIALGKSNLGLIFKILMEAKTNFAIRIAIQISRNSCN